MSRHSSVTLSQICQSVSVSPSVYLSFFLSVFQHVSLSVNLPICLSICLSMNLDFRGKDNHDSTGSVAGVSAESGGQRIFLHWARHWGSHFMPLASPTSISSGRPRRNMAPNECLCPVRDLLDGSIFHKLRISSRKFYTPTFAYTPSLVNYSIHFRQLCTYTEISHHYTTVLGCYFHIHIIGYHLYSRILFLLITQCVFQTFRRVRVCPRLEWRDEVPRGVIVPGRSLYWNSLPLCI